MVVRFYLRYKDLPVQTRNDLFTCADTMARLVDKVTADQSGIWHQTQVDAFDEAAETWMLLGGVLSDYENKTVTDPWELVMGEARVERIRRHKIKTKRQPDAAQVARKRAEKIHKAALALANEAAKMDDEPTEKLKKLMLEYVEVSGITPKESGQWRAIIREARLRDDRRIEKERTGKVARPYRTKAYWDAEKAKQDELDARKAAGYPPGLPEQDSETDISPYSPF